MKATVKNIKGNCLVIDKHNSLDSMLFLEAMAEITKSVQKRMAPPSILIEDDPEKHCFRVYLHLHKTTLVRIAKYINDNSDNS